MSRSQTQKLLTILSKIQKWKESLIRPLRSSSRVYHGAIVVFASCEGSFIPVAAWCIQSVTDLSILGRLTKVWHLDMWFSLQQSWFELFYCIYHAWATSDYGQSVTEASFTSTIVTQVWCISDAFPTTTLAWLMWDVVQFYPVVPAAYYHCIHQRWMLLSRGEWWESV